LTAKTTSGETTLIRPTALFSAALMACAPSFATEVHEVLAHPIFGEPFACGEHWLGNLQEMGDALGSDCVIEDMVTEDGRTWMRTHKGDGRDNADWFGWGKDVLSPCDCEVVKVGQNPAVNRPGELGKPPAAALFLRRGDGVQFVLAHIAAPRVRAGDRVNAGQPIAQVGNNGMSRHPHIHIGAWKGQEALQVRFDLAAMGRLLKDW
jgi:hypothetical protein